MIKYVFTILLSGLVVSLSAQDTVKKDTTWKLGGLFAVTFSQSGFENWSAGGENNVVLNGKSLLFANYAKNKITWDNSANLAFGLSRQSSLGERKTDDLAEINSKFGLQATEKWYYSALLTSKTQFADGFEYPTADSSVLISRPFTPLKTTLALGMDFKPNEHLTIFLSPLSYENTYISDTSSNFPERYNIERGKNARNDFGFLIRAGYSKEIVKNLNILTRVDFSGAYDRIEGAEDIDVNWEFLLTYNVFKVLSININTHLIWDNDVRFAGPDGQKESITRLQFKEIFGAGIAYNF